MMNYKEIKKNRLFISTLFLIIILGFAIRIKIGFFGEIKDLFSQEEFDYFISAGYQDPYQINKNIFNLFGPAFSTKVSSLYALYINLFFSLVNNVYALRLVSVLPNLLSLIVSIFFTKKLCDLFSTRVNVTKSFILLVSIIHSFMYNNIIQAVKVAPDSFCYLLVLVLYVLILSYLNKPSYSYAISILILVLIIVSFQSLLSLTLLPPLFFFVLKNETHKKEKLIFAVGILSLLYLTFKTPLSFISLSKLASNFFNLFIEFFSSPFNLTSFAFTVSLIFLFLYLYGVISFLVERKFGLFSISFLPMLSLIVDSSNLFIPRFLPCVLIGIFYVFTKIIKEEISFPSTVPISITIFFFLFNQGVFTLPVNYNNNFLKIEKSKNQFDLKRNSEILDFLHHNLSDNYLVAMEDNLRFSFYRTVPLMRLSKTLLCKGNQKCLEENKVLDLASLTKPFCTFKIDNNQDFLNECLSSQGNRDLIIISKNLKDESLLMNLLSSKNNYKLTSRSYLKDWYHLKFSK